MDNNLRMNEIPLILSQLNNLELRILAPRQVFQWIHTKPVSNEKYCRGNLVLVPANPQATLESLKNKIQVPCSEARAEIIKLDLKRRLSDKKAYISSTIRPDLVIAAAKYLATTPLYKALGITFDDNWDSRPFVRDLTEAQTRELLGEDENVPENVPLQTDESDMYKDTDVHLENVQMGMLKILGSC